MKPAVAKSPYYQPRPTVARIVFALTLGSAIAVGLYIWFGQMDPVPTWISVPANAKLAESRVSPNKMLMPGMIVYYMRVVVPGTDVKTELRNFAHGVERVDWRDAREMNKDDAFIRLGFPSWVNERMIKNHPLEGAWCLESSESQEQIHLYGWPGEAGKCIIELVMKTGGLSEPVEETYETEFAE